ncbi:hypothetical protein TWF730_010918 [Orbilia blumenaviensis]|uniref:Uncharacterized protein n=1 Tax=Orbilia blumenaviensis TaxID=1796055 RepID=A0AAV9UQ42_9PEZI
MPLFRRSKETKTPCLNYVPPTSFSNIKSLGGTSDASRPSIVSVSSATCDWLRSEQECINSSKSDILGHALHLARLAVVLDKAQVYTGAARAYFDCCYVLSTVEEELGEVELEITNMISQTYKQRLAYLSARVAISGRSSLSFPSHMTPAPEFHIDLSQNSKQSPRLVELNRICQLLRALGHCCEIVQAVYIQDGPISKPQDSGAEAILGLSAEFQKLREDISRFREFYSNLQLANGEAGNILFVILGSFKKKVEDLVEGENKKLLVFLLSLFDIQLPAAYEAELKPLPPQPLRLKFKTPSFQASSGNYAATPDPPVSPLSAGPSVKYATTIPEDEREPVQLAPAPIPPKSSRRPHVPGDSKESPVVSYPPDIQEIDEKMRELVRKGSFLLV